MTRRRKRLIIAAFALPVLAYAGWAGYVRLCCEPVQNNTVRGRTEDQIRRSYGAPVEDRQGNHSLGLVYHIGDESDHARVTPVPPVRTLIFHPRVPLHPEGGTLWVAR
jgi:hypothetical protein